MSLMMAQLKFAGMLESASLGYRQEFSLTTIIFNLTWNVFQTSLDYWKNFWGAWQREQTSLFLHEITSWHLQSSWSQYPKYYEVNWALFMTRETMLHRLSSMGKEKLDSSLPSYKYISEGLEADFWRQGMFLLDLLEEDENILHDGQEH